MINPKKTEKNENYKILSIFIDNIVKQRLAVDECLEITLNSYDILIVRNGSIRMELGGRDDELETNDAMLINKGEKAVIHGLAGEECWIVHVYFDGIGVSGMLQYLQFMHAFKFNVSGNALAACMDNMLQTWETGEYFRSAIMLQTLLITIKDTEERNYMTSNLNEIYQYIQEHYAEPLDLNQLAQVYGSSVSYFSRAFKQHFGIAPMAFVNTIRLHYARLYLATSKMRIRDIAQRCGFEKLEYFCYVFKKSEGCTPSQYRSNRKYADKLLSQQVLE